VDSKTFKRLSPLSLLVLSACGGGGTSIGGGSFSVGGRVIKGPLEGAWVRLDYDDPTIPDSTPVETDEFGAYTITALNNNYTVVAVTDEGTIDKSSDTTLSGVTLKAPQGASVVTPSTTLMEEGDLTADQVAEVLGLPDGVDPLSFNPFDIDETDATQVANALAVEKASQQVMSVVTAFASAAEGAGASEADAFTAALNSVVKVVQDKAANLTKEGATDAEKSLNLTNADDLALIQTQAEDAVENISGLSEIQVAAFDNLAADTATAVINVNDRIAGVEDLDDGADVFSSVQVLAGQVAEAVADEVETPDSGSIAFTSVTAVANSVLNSAPTAIELSSVSFSEATGVSIAIGTLITTDPDNASGFKYSIAQAQGTDYSNFVVDSDTGQLYFLEQPDYETKSSYTVRISSEDPGGKVFSETFEIKVTDSNEAPVLSLPVVGAVSEDASVLVVEGTLSGSDPEGGELSYSISDVAVDSGVYTASGTYGVLVLIEATGSYTYTINNELPAVNSLGSSDIVSDEFEVKVGDGTNTSSAQTLTITIQGQNDAPTAPILSNSNIDENVAGDSVGEIASSDAEGQDVSYTIADGGDGASFEINGSTLKLKSSVTADVETKSIYTVTVDAGDGSESSSATFTVNVSDKNDTPVVSQANVTVSAAEDSAFSYNLIENNIVFSDQDEAAGDELTLTLSESTPAWISLNEAGDSLVGTPLNADAGVSNFSIIASDKAGQNVSLDVTASVTSNNDAPVMDAVVGASVGSNEVGPVVAVLTAADEEDGISGFTFKIVDSTGSEVDDSESLFEISADGVSLKLKDTVTTDLQETPSYEVFVQAIDSGGASSSIITISVDVTGDTPPEITEFNISTTGSDAALGVGDIITITALTSEPVNQDGTVTLTLSNNETIVMTRDVTVGNKLSGTYEVEAGQQDTPTLSITSYNGTIIDNGGLSLAAVTDETALSDGDFSVDATAPTTSLDQTVDALYTVSTSTLDLTITNASELGLSDGDIKANLDWASLSWDVDKSGADPVPFSSSYITSATLDASAGTLSIVLNSDGIAAFEPLAGFGGSDATGTLDGLDMGVGFFRDIAGNDSSASNVANLTIDLADTTAPTISSIAAAVTTDQDGDGYLDTSDVVTFTATMDSAMKSGTDFTMRLSNDQTVTMVTSSVDAAKMTGTYTVGSTDADFSSLAVSSYTVVDAVDTSGNALDGTSTISDLDAAVESATLKRDATAPTTSLDQTVDALYTVSTSTLDLTITNASELGLSDGDIKANLDWASLSWDVDKSGADPVPFSSSYVTSATLDASAGTLSIVLNSDGIAAFEPLADFGGSDATGTLDGLDMGVGFFRDIAGNDSSASNVANLTIDLADTTAPTISSITAVATGALNGKLNGGDSISFSAEVDSVIKAGTSFNMLLDNGDTISMSTGVSNSNTLSGSLTLTDESIETDLLSVQSYTVVDAVDLSGNALVSDTAVANFDQVKDSSIKIDTTAPGLYLNTFEADGVTANLLTLKFTEAISNTSEVDAALRALNIVDNSTSGTWSGSDTVFQIETNEALTEDNNDLTLSLTFEDLAGNSVTLNEIEDFQII
jgi:VCBS repeat-containing protein